MVTPQDMRRAGILAIGPGSVHDIGNVGGIAQTHVKALCADRRQHMCGFADQRNAMPGKWRGRFDRKWK